MQSVVTGQAPGSNITLERKITSGGNKLKTEDNTVVCTYVEPASTRQFSQLAGANKLLLLPLLLPLPAIVAMSIFYACPCCVDYRSSTSSSRRVSTSNESFDCLCLVGMICVFAIINTSYQKLPFGSGDYPDKLLFHQALNYVSTSSDRELPRDIFVSKPARITLVVCTRIPGTADINGTSVACVYA